MSRIAAVVWARHQYRRTFRCRRIEIARHDPVPVSVGVGNDNCRRHRSSCDLQSWSCIRRNQLD